MDLLKKRLDIARLIAEELTGTIDERDRAVLTRWLDEDERHRKEYTNILESLKTGNEVCKDQERGRQIMESRWRTVKSHTIRKTVRWITWSKYAAGYMWGVTGVLYNPEKMTEEEASTWDVFLNDKFKRQVTIKDNVRDSYFAALGSYRKDELMDESLRNAPDYQERLMQIMNDVDSDTIETVEDILQDMQGTVYSFETDSGKADMISGKVVANYQWSGDAVYAMDQAEEDDFYLDFAVPEESTNLWFDGWVMLKDGIGQDAEKQQAAEAFVNFVSRPDNAVRNMYYIGYTSVISGGDDDTVYDYLKWNYEAEDDEEDTTEYPVGFFFCGDDSNEDYIMTVPEEQTRRQLFAQYPTQEVLQRSAVMQYFDDTANKEINQMWINVRCYNIEDVPVQIWIFVGVAIVLVIYITIRIRMSHYREKK